MTKKAHFTFEQHQKVGAELKAIDRALMDMTIELARAYPKTSKACVRLGKALREVGIARSMLENEMFKENPELPNAPSSFGVYYGDNREGFYVDSRKPTPV